MTVYYTILAWHSYTVESHRVQTCNFKLRVKVSNMSQYQSLLHSLCLNNKGKLICTASYDSLQRFVEEYLNLREGSWSCPGGDAKLYKSGDVSIRWYVMTYYCSERGRQS